MEIGDLSRGGPIGTVVPILGGDGRDGVWSERLAYVPDPLPTSIELSGGTWQTIAEAAHLLGRLDETGHRLPDPEVITRPQTVREAQSTLALSGTNLTFTNIIEAELGPAGKAEPSLRAALNYMRVAEVADRRVGEGVITVGFVNDVHAQLLSGTAADSSDVGVLRSGRVSESSPNDRDQAQPQRPVRFAPPPPGTILEAGVQEWADWVNHKSPDLDPIVRAALSYYQFLTLSPYARGNGRLGRLLLLLHLRQSGVMRHALLSISPWFEERRRAHQDHLLWVSQTGDYDTWVRFCAQALRDQAAQTLVKVDAFVLFAARASAIVSANGVRGTGRALADDLIAYPVVTPTSVKRRYDVSYPAANNAVARLASVGLLTEISGRRYDRVFACEELIRIAEV